MRLNRIKYETLETSIVDRTEGELKSFRLIGRVTRKDWGKIGKLCNPVADRS